MIIQLFINILMTSGFYRGRIWAATHQQEKKKYGGQESYRFPNMLLGMCNEVFHGFVRWDYWQVFYKQG